MAWSRRPLGEPFTIPLGTEIGPPRDMEFFAGERLLVDVGEAATMSFSETEGGAPLEHTESASGEFDWPALSVLVFIPEGEMRFWYVWTGTSEDLRLRALGRIRSLPSAYPGEATIYNVVFGADNVVAGPFNVVYAEVA
jgi:hypothetical protein